MIAALAITAALAGPAVHIDAARTQHVLQQRNLLVAVTSSEDAKVRITAHIDVGGTTRHYPTIGYQRHLIADTKREFKLIVAKTKRARLSLALAHGHQLTAHVRVSVRDSAGNATVKKFTIRCVR